MHTPYSFDMPLWITVCVIVVVLILIFTVRSKATWKSEGDGFVTNCRTTISVAGIDFSRVHFEGDEAAVYSTLARLGPISQAEIARQLGWVYSTGNPQKLRVWKAIQELAALGAVRKGKDGRWEVAPS